MIWMCSFFMDDICFLSISMFCFVFHKSIVFPLPNHLSSRLIPREQQAHMHRSLVVAPVCLLLCAQLAKTVWFSRMGRLVHFLTKILMGYWYVPTVFLLIWELLLPFQFISYSNFFGELNYFYV